VDDSQPLTTTAVAPDPAELSTIERAELGRYEAVIKRGIDTFVAVGNALSAIRRERLYRATHRNFEEYCEKRWQMTYSYANKLMAASEVVGNLTTENRTIVHVLPQTESQARPLAKLEPEQQREVWVEVIESAPNGNVTAAHVQTVVNQYRDEVKPKLAVHYSSDTPEHYTPQEIIHAVIECMGAIDLDPCSNSKTAPNVPAKCHYTVEDDGLVHAWHGRVYLNPPYGREISKWIDKLRSEYDADNVTEAIALVPARTDTDWFDRLIEGYRLHCFVHGRLVFIGNDNSAPFPSAIVYLGDNDRTFFDTFEGFGRIVQELHPEMILGEP
jgi:hypothetical protein